MHFVQMYATHPIDCDMYNSIRFFKIVYDLPIVHSHCPILYLIFQPIRQTIK